MKRISTILLMMLLVITASAATKKVKVRGSQGLLSVLIETPEVSGKVPMVIMCHGFGGKKEGGIFDVVAAVLRDDAIRGNTFGKMYDLLDPPEYVDLFGGQKLGAQYIKTAFWLPIYETAANYHGAACMIHGTGDRVVPFTYSERYHNMWKDSELHLIDAEDHGFTKNAERAAVKAADFIEAKMK